MPCIKYEYTQNQVNLMNQLRMLWEQHVQWTRAFIISTAASLGDLKDVTDRLLQNPSDFADVFRKYYGPEIANTFQELLTQHLLIGGDLVHEAKEGDTAEAEIVRAKWYANADEIAAFLAKINPYWDETKWKTFLYDHLQMTEQEATLRLQGRYKEDIQMFDKIEQEALQMADYMFQGLSQQFFIF